MLETKGTRPLSWYAEQAPDELWDESDERRKSMGDLADDLTQDAIDSLLEEGKFEVVEELLGLRPKPKERSKSMKRQFFIAGVQFRPRNEIDKAGRIMVPGDSIILEPEPSNKFDPNAVKLIFALGGAENADKVFLGYVPKKFSSEVAGMLSIGAPVECVVNEVDPGAKTYEMFKVTVQIPVDEEEESEDDFDSYEPEEGVSER